MDVHITLILGTNRKDNQSQKVASYIQDKVKEQQIMYSFFDVKDFDLPQNNYGQSMKEQFVSYKETIEKTDALIIISPEYNHGYPGVLKSVLDMLLPEYTRKAVGTVGVSAGMLGGARMIESLIHVYRELGLVTIKTDLLFGRVSELFDERGQLKDRQAYDQRAQTFLQELIWMATVLKWGRAHVT